MTKHAAIYPSEDELQSIQKIVSITERALKLVSDIITDQDKGTEEDKDKKEPAKDRWAQIGSFFLFSFWSNWLPVDGIRMYFTFQKNWILMARCLLCGVTGQSPEGSDEGRRPG